MPPLDLEPLVYSVTEVAALLKCSRRYVYLMCEAGDLPCLRLGKKVLIPRKALDRMIETASGIEAGAGA